MQKLNEYSKITYLQGVYHHASKQPGLLHVRETHSSCLDTHIFVGEYFLIASVSSCLFLCLQQVADSS